MEQKTGATFQRIILIAFLGGISASTVAQTPQTMQGDLESALQKAQTAAYRPGDESLSCEKLESELVVVVKDPALQSHVAKSGAVAQEKIAAMNAASQNMAAQSALTIFSSIVPGGAWAGQAAAAAQLPAQRMQTARNIEQAMLQAQEMIGVMPQIMRGQRVLELAQARDCAWLRDSLAR